MTSFQAFVMGIVQGLTEFLPVSSSGHLKLAQHFFGFENLDSFIPFDLACHLGTLLTILIVFRHEIRRILFEDRKMMALVFLGTLPLVPLFLVLSQIKEIIGSPELLGYFFLLTATLLFLGDTLAGTRPKSTTRIGKLLDVILVGISQAIAVLPGVSRSGSTISTARMLGWDASEAATFSFMLAIPTILGASLLEFKDIVEDPQLAHGIPVSAYAIGFFTSFVIGYFALKYLLHLLKGGKLTPFIWYCASIGCLTLGWINFGM